MSNELKPCPFCGGDANEKPESQHMPDCYFDVLARLKAAPKSDLSLVPAVLKAWNRRAQPAVAGGMRDYLAEFAEGEVEAKTAIEELQDALSAVTAERDRLIAAAEDEAVEGDHNLVPSLQEEVGQLRAEVEALNRAIKARLPGRGIAAVGTGALHAEQDYCYRRGWKEGVAALRAQIRAAMAAKEGEK